MAVQTVEDFLEAGLRKPRAPHASALLRPGTAQAAAGLGLLSSGGGSRGIGGRACLDRVFSSATQSPRPLWVPSLIRAGSRERRPRHTRPGGKPGAGRGGSAGREAPRGRRA